MTLIGHAALGATAYGVLRPHEKTTRWGLSRRALLLCCLLLPMLPDADVVMHLWVKYGHPLGHRGVSHSLLFALLFSLGLAWLLQRLGRADEGRSVLGRMTLAFTLLIASHGVTDAMTTGGKAPRLLWPIKAEGVWLPERFIPVSPMGSSLLRTNWKKKQLASSKKKRARLLRRKNRSQALIREAVSWSKRPDHYRRLVVVGVAMTELVLLVPFMLLALLLWLWQRWRHGPAAKDPPRTRPPPEAPPEGPPPRLWPSALASALALVLVVVVGALVRAPDAGISISSGHLDDAASTHYRHLTPAKVDEHTPVAVLLHGWRCSHQMMMGIGRALARNGVEVWAIDLPGHGSSPRALETGCEGKKRTCVVSSSRLFMREFPAILDHLVESQGLAERDVILLGHSTGAVTTHDVRGGAADSLTARVIIEGRYRKLVEGGNRLIIGKSKYTKKWGQGLEPDVFHGSFEDGSAIELFSVNRKHLALVHDQRVNERTLRWIADAAEVSLGDAAAPYRERHIAWAVAMALLGLALNVLAATHAARRGWLPPVRPTGYARPGVAIACMMLGSIAAALWASELWRVGGAPWLQARVGLFYPTYLMCTILCIVTPYVALTRRPGIPDLRSVAVDVALALLGFLCIYLSFGLAVDRYFFHLSLPAWRWPRMLGWSLAFLPLSLLVHEVGLERDRWWARLVSLLLHAVTWGALLWVVAVGRSGGHVADAKRFVLVVVIAEIWALCIGWRRRSRLLSALLSALVLAWIFTASYPILAGAP